jgi:hypothetical protein
VVEHGDGVGNVLVVVVLLLTHGPIRLAVAPAVEGDHPVVAGEVRQLCLPDP